MKPLILALGNEKTYETVINEEFREKSIIQDILNVEDAELIIKENPINLCILDYNIPKEYRICIHKSLHERFPHISIIFISTIPIGWEETAHILSGEYRVDYFVKKPFDIFEFDNIIQQCLSNSRIDQAYKIIQSYQNNNKKQSSLLKKRKQNREKRLSKIYELICENPQKWTCQMLADKFEVSKRQIVRDIQQLKKHGLPIASTTNGYKLEENKIGAERNVFPLPITNSSVD